MQIIMKPIRRLLFILFFLLGIIVFAGSVTFVLPLQYLFTGKDTWGYDIADWLDMVLNKIKPDK